MQDDKPRACVPVNILHQKPPTSDQTEWRAAPEIYDRHWPEHWVFPCATFPWWYSPHHARSTCQWSSSWQESELHNPRCQNASLTTISWLEKPQTYKCSIKRKENARGKLGIQLTPCFASWLTQELLYNEINCGPEVRGGGGGHLGWRACKMTMLMWSIDWQEEGLKCPIQIELNQEVLVYNYIQLSHQTIKQSLQVVTNETTWCAISSL